MKSQLNVFSILFSGITDFIDIEKQLFADVLQNRHF